MKIFIELSNNKKVNYFLKFLKDLPYIQTIEVVKDNKQIRTKNKPDFNSIFGIWKDRNITFEQIKKKAWKRL